MEIFIKIADIIEKHTDFVLTSHVNPDGDSIGCEIAFYRYLISLQKRVSIINFSPTPENYRFLDKDNVIQTFDSNKHRNVIENSEVIIILDTNDYKRLKDMSEFIQNSNAIKICIDHHMGINPEDYSYFIADTDSPATGEILYKYLIQYGKNTIGQDLAIPLYTAIMTDTGSFRFPRTDSETHRITADLIDAGADPVSIYENVYDKSNPGKLKLLSAFLNNVQLIYTDELAYSELSQREFEETGTSEIDTEGFNKHLMSLEKTKMCIIFTETKNGLKISFRSKDKIPVNLLASEFGGGGHLNAAGAFIKTDKSDIKKIIDEVLKSSKKYLNQTG